MAEKCQWCEEEHEGGPENCSPQKIPVPAEKPKEVKTVTRTLVCVGDPKWIDSTLKHNHCQDGDTSFGSAGVITAKTYPGTPFHMWRFQYEVGQWAGRNFPGTTDSSHALMGLVEEIGELHHARLKEAQGIRHSAKECKDMEIDAIGDLIIYLADYCCRRDIDLQSVIMKTWDRVQKRDWIKYPETGFPPDPAPVQELP